MATTPISWVAPLDPAEIKDYTHSFQPELVATSDTITSSTFILPSDAIAAGLQIDSQIMTAYGGLVFFAVDIASQAAAMFDGAGTQFRIRHQIDTSFGRTLERSIYLTVKQL